MDRTITIWHPEEITSERINSLVHKAIENCKWGVAIIPPEWHTKKLDEVDFLDDNLKIEFVDSDTLASLGYISRYSIIAALQDMGNGDAVSAHYFKGLLNGDGDIETLDVLLQLVLFGVVRYDLPSSVGQPCDAKENVTKYEIKDYDFDFEFDKGEISFSTWYDSADINCGALCSEKTKKLYEVMKNYYQR